MFTKNTLRLILLSVCTLFLFGCGPDADSRYDSGYSDGYAAGYNTECKIRSTVIEGDWEDENYTRGYNDGDADGINQCRADRKNR